MPLWFQIVVLVLLACIAVSAIDLCFALDSLNRNFANFATRIEAAIRDRNS
jgi:hypothetical protein